LLERRQVVGNDFKDLFGDWRPDEEGRKPDEEFRLEPENRIRRALNEKEVKIVNVYEAVPDNSSGQPAQHQNQTFVLLRDNRGRELRIYVLRDVALAISLGLESETPDRPFTHDLMKNILDRLGGTVERVTIDDLWQETFYARITLDYKGETIDIDARPSDAIALALRYKAPVYVAEAVLEATTQE
jgi:bifunctional DNase/RNase